MRIGLVKEIKDKENRVALTPAGAGQLVVEGHHVSVEENAGVGSSFPMTNIYLLVRKLYQRSQPGITI